MCPENKTKIRNLLFIFFPLFLFFTSMLISQEKLSPKDLDSEFRKWLEEEVVYIITPKERDVFLQLTTDRERMIFIEAFWKQRDPNPNLPGNEFKEEHYERIAYVNNWFGRDTPGPGWRTDRGRIYITLGPPNSIDRFENSGEFYPFIIWFYEGMLEYKLPNAFNVAFFKKDGTGDYMLYSPVKYGPQYLVIHYYGDMTENQQAYYKLLDIEPQVAQVSLSLLPGDVTGYFSPSLASEILISQRIPAAPHEKVKDAYAEKLLKYKDIIEVDYTANYIDSDFTVRVIQDRSGIFFVHYLIEPTRLTFEEYQGKYHSNLEINGQISDQTGKSIYQFERTIPINFDESQMMNIKNKLFSFQDMFPVAPGKYKFFSLIKNTVSKEFSSIESSIFIPDSPSLQISQITLSNKLNKDSKYKGKNKPFLIGSFQLVPTPRNDFIRDDTMYVYFQLQGMTEELKEDASLVYTILKEDEQISSQVKSIKDYSDRINIFEEFTLTDFSPAYYYIKISLLDGNQQEVASQEAPFLLTHISTLARPWVLSLPSGSSEDPALANILGNQYLNKGDKIKAKTLLEQAYNKNPNNSKFALDISKILFEAKEFQRIKQIADPFLQDQRKYGFLQILGQSCQALGELNEAIFFYKEYLGYFGTNLLILNSIGDCYYQLNNYEEALTAWERSLEISPDQERIKSLIKSIKEKKNEK